MAPIIRPDIRAPDKPLKQRFAKQVKLLKAAPKDLEDHFRKRVRRRVTKDRTVSLDSRLYEDPIALISEQVELLYHPDHLEFKKPPFMVRIPVKYRGKTGSKSSDKSLSNIPRINTDAL